MNEKTQNFFGYCLCCVCVGIGACFLLGLVTLLGYGHPNCEPTTEGYAWFWLTMWACVTSASAGSVPFACILAWVAGKVYKCFS